MPIYPSQLNTVVFGGRIGKRPEVREFSGSQVIQFPMACNERYTVNGESKEHTTWMLVQRWKPNPFLLQLRKGDAIEVLGRLRQYKKDDGTIQTYIDANGGIYATSTRRDYDAPKFKSDSETDSSYAIQADEPIPDIEMDEPPF